MNRLVEAAREIDEFMHQQGWRYCVVGGLAVARWGEPRTTQDVDICLFAGLGNETAFIETLLGTFRPRIESAAKFAETNRVVLIEASNNVSIDIALGWTPFEDKMLSRAAPFPFASNVSVRMATAEDLVVTKAFAARAQDWIDISGILARERGNLDWNYIRGELIPLCELKEAPEIVDRLEQLRSAIANE